MKYQVAIIGGGPAGYTAAEAAGKAGLSVVLFEKQSLSGVCLNEGCIPTKTLLYSAKTYDGARHAAKYAVSVPEVSFDLPKIIARKQKVVRKLVLGIKGKLTAHGVTIVSGEATVTDKNHVECGGETYECENLLLCTGSETFVPAIPGIDKVPYWTHCDALDNKELPASLAIIGGGVIGMEFASAFQTFGSEVTVVEFLKECLPPIDADIAKRMRKALEKRGIKFYMQSGVQDIRTIPGAEGRDTAVVTFERKGQRVDLEADVVLVATGRGAYMDHLNLEAAGVAYDRKGITVDDNMQTNVPGVYAIGDVNGRIQLAHAAEAQGLRAVNHILGKTDGIRLDVVPSAIFTYPEAACVGPTEDQLKQSGAPYTVRKSFYRSNGKAVAMEETEGLLKLFVAEDGKLLGCHVYGAHAADIVQEVSALICREATVEDLHDTIHIHPTLSEILLDAAM